MYYIKTGLLELYKYWYIIIKNNYNDYNNYNNNLYNNNNNNYNNYNNNLYNNNNNLYNKKMLERNNNNNNINILIPLPKYFFHQKIKGNQIMIKVNMKKNSKK